MTDFAAAAVLRGAHVERVTSQSHDGSRPMGAFVDLVPALLRARGALGVRLSSMDALRSLMGGQAQSELPEQAAGAEEHEQRWAAVSRAVMDLCDAIATEGMLVLVIEDAHWLDTLSANTIGRIIGTRRKARIMVVATTRDARPLVRDLRLTERSRTLTLAPLDGAGAKEILDGLLPAPERGSSAEQSAGAYWLKSRIADISAGNPLFLISLALHSLAHPGEFEVPGTIVETFAQRIDALSRHAMSVLATCSELGKHSTLARLVRSTGDAEAPACRVAAGVDECGTRVARRSSRDPGASACVGGTAGPTTPPRAARCRALGGGDVGAGCGGRGVAVVVVGCGGELAGGGQSGESDTCVEAMRAACVGDWEAGGGGENA